MKLERTKNAARNIVFDGTLEMVNMIFPFVIRSVMLHYLGTEYLGLNGLFKSLLTFLNLAELGVGSAMVFSMYKPIAEDDTSAVCALLRLYRTLYRIIGLAVAAVGLLLIPVLPKLIKGDLPADMNLYVLYLMNLGNTVVTYWLFAYKGSLLQAHQRRDIISKVSLAVRLTEYSLKILILVFTRNYYLYLAVQLLCQIIVNLLTAVWAAKMYPQYVPAGKLPKEKTLDIFRRVRDLGLSELLFYHYCTANDPGRDPQRMHGRSRQQDGHGEQGSELSGSGEDQPSVQLDSGRKYFHAAVRVSAVHECLDGRGEYACHWACVLLRCILLFHGR